MGKKWTDQFAESLSGWCKGTGSGDLIGADLSGPGADPLSRFMVPGDDGVGNVAMRAFAHLAAVRAHTDLEIGLGLSGSPIEEAMFCALYVAASVESDELHLGSPGESPPSWAPTHIYIGQQVEIGDYRVDFLLSGREYDGFDDKPVWKTARLIVECDGHDFHDKTKKQARRDKRRDRQLQAAGYPVFRFTGSEIWADVFGVATEAVVHLKSQMK